jgi:hypothetical protein
MKTIHQQTLTLPAGKIIQLFSLSLSNNSSFSVTIHTTATKSDSDSRLTRKSIDSHGSEHSLQSKSLLSPDTAKKSRKNRRREHRQNASKTSGNTQSEQTSIVTSDASNITTHVSSDNNKYLSKETRFLINFKII